MTTVHNSPQKTEFDFIVKESFLAVYHGKSEDNNFGYDAVLQIADMDIYILHAVTEIESDSSDVPKNKLYEGSRKTVNDLMRRHLKLQKSFNKKRNSANLSTDKQKIYFIGLATLMVAFDNKYYSIDHQFGSAYFQEQLVLDFDGDDNLLQLFGSRSFLTILKLLSTPTDILSFLSYHRKHLIEQTPYQYETILANSFLKSPNLLDKALEVEKHLIEIDLLDRHDGRLLQAIENNDSKTRELLIQKMRESSDLWIKLLQSTTAREMKGDHPLPKEVIKKLIAESLYTRMKIIEDVFAHGNKSKQSHQDGYVLYQHSYSQFGRQYMLVMYGLDKTSWLSREAVKQEKLNLLINLNSQLQDPVMDDLILLGFDLSQIRDNGDVDVQMDVYHLKATKMTEIEQYLNQQLVALKAKTRVV